MGKKCLIKYARKSLHHSLHYQKNRGSPNSKVKPSSKRYKQSEKKPVIKQAEPQYDETVLMNINNKWKEPLLEVYGEPVIAKFESLLSHFRLINGRSAFTIFRDELIAERRKEQKAKIERGDIVEVKKYNNEENRYNFGKNNKADKEIWKTVKKENKAPYKEKSTREKKLYKLEFNITEKLLFLGYNSIEKKFAKGPEEIYKLEKYLDFYEKLRNDQKVEDDSEKELDSEYNDLADNVKEEYKKKYNILNNRREEAKNIVNQNARDVYGLLKNNQKENKSPNKQPAEIEEQNEIILDKAWSKLNFEEKDPFYQAREKLKSSEEIYNLINSLRNRDYYDAPYQPDKLFYFDLKNNFHCYHDLGTSKALELWNNCPDKLKKMYKCKYNRLNLEYKFMKLIKDKIIKKAFKKHGEKVDEVQIGVNVLNEAKPEIKVTKEVYLKNRGSFKDDLRRKIKAGIRHAKKVAFQNFKNRYNFQFHKKNFSPVEIYARENSDIVKKKMNKEKMKFYKAAGNIYNNDLSEEQRELYKKKCNAINDILAKENDEIIKEGFCKKSVYDWYLKFKYNKKPENPVYILENDENIINEANEDNIPVIQEEEEKEELPGKKKKVNARKKAKDNKNKKSEDKNQLISLINSYKKSDNLKYLSEVLPLVQKMISSKENNDKAEGDNEEAGVGKKNYKELRKERAGKGIFQLIYKEMVKEHKARDNNENDQKIMEDKDANIIKEKNVDVEENVDLPQIELDEKNEAKDQKEQIEVPKNGGENIDAQNNVEGKLNVEKPAGQNKDNKDEEIVKKESNVKQIEKVNNDIKEVINTEIKAKEELDDEPNNNIAPVKPKENSDEQKLVAQKPNPQKADVEKNDDQKTNAEIKVNIDADIVKQDSSIKPMEIDNDDVEEEINTELKVEEKKDTVVGKNIKKKKKAKITDKKEKVELAEYDEGIRTRNWYKNRKNENSEKIKGNEIEEENCNGMEKSSLDKDNKKEKENAEENSEELSEGTRVKNLKKKINKFFEKYPEEKLEEEKEENSKKKLEEDKKEKSPVKKKKKKTKVLLKNPEEKFEEKKEEKVLCKKRKRDDVKPDKSPEKDSNPKGNAYKKKKVGTTASVNDGEKEEGQDATDNNKEKAIGTGRTKGTARINATVRGKRTRVNKK